MIEIYKAKWILTANEQVIEDGALVVENGKILDVLDFQKTEIYLEVINTTVFDFGNAVITPGFINLHAHLQYTDIGRVKSKLFKNKLKNSFLSMKKNIAFLFKDKKSFTSWIVELIKEYSCWENQLKRQSFENGLAQSLLSGTTCIAQLSGEEEFFDILNSSPIKSYIFLEVFACSKESAKISFQELVQKYEKLSPKCSSSTFLGISPHSVYTVHRQLWDKINQFSKKKNLLVHAHFAESKEEMSWLKNGVSNFSALYRFIGCKPLKPCKECDNSIEFLYKLGILNRRLIVAHINQLDEMSLKLLASNKVNVVSCPRSNMLLHKKMLNLETALNCSNGRVGLGTDSLYSNYDLNMLNEAKFVSDEFKGLSLLKILDMLTINGAKILRLDNKIGSLEKGKDADFLVFKLENEETYKNLLEKEKPDEVFILGKQIVKNKVLI